MVVAEAPFPVVAAVYRDPGKGCQGHSMKCTHLLLRVQINCEF